jgi:hypothetical protein
MNIDISNEQKFLEQYKKKIIKDVLKTLCKQYFIYDTNDNEVDIDTLQKQFLFPKVLRRCIGTTNTNPVSQCSKNAIDNYDYCKIHLYKMCLSRHDIDDTTHDSYIPPIEFNCTSKPTDVHNLQKKFIEDSFYFVDDKFIYDSNNIKVGYICNEEYILTSDPFILETLDI